MWFLTNVNTGQLFFLRGERISVGRTADFRLENDKSISRTHAHIEPKKDEVWISDTGSVYGTYINDGIEKLQGLEKGVATKIVSKDRIMFGRLANEWVLSKIEFKTVTSMLAEEKKQKLLKALQADGFEVVDNWQEGVTHLTMPSCTTATIKILYALAACIHIVTPKFWVEVLKAVAQNKPLPDYSLYMPVLSEPFLDTVSLDVNLKRKLIFAGKCFVFMSNTQMEGFRAIIELAGGTCLGKHNNTINKNQLLNKKYVAMQYHPSERTQMSQSHMVMEDLRNFLKKHKKRFVPDVEIGLAILHCSTSQHCNSDLKFDELWKPDEAAQLKIKTSTVLVAESEEQPLNVKNIDHLNISATQSQGLKLSNVKVISAGQPIVYAANTDTPKEYESVITSIEISDSDDERMSDKSSKMQANKRKSSLRAQNNTSEPSTSKKARYDTVFDDSPELQVISQKALPVRRTTRKQTETKVVNAFEKLKDFKIKDSKAMAAPVVPSKKIVEKDLPQKGAVQSDKSKEEVSSNLQNRGNKKSAKETSVPLKLSEWQLPTTSNSSMIAPTRTSPRGKNNRAILVQPQATLDSRSTNKRNLFSIDLNDDDDKLFDFVPKRSKKSSAPIVSQILNESIKEDVPPSSLTASNLIAVVPRQVSNIAVFTNVEMKAKLSGSWLSKKMGSMTLKVDGVEVKKEKFEDLRDENITSWIEQVKGAFGVNEIKVDVTKRVDALLLNASNNTTSSSGKKNFKAFVKKNNFKPQSVVVQTHPVMSSFSVRMNL